jgi:hypothetical protein
MNAMLNSPQHNGHGLRHSRQGKISGSNTHGEDERLTVWSVTKQVGVVSDETDFFKPGIFAVLMLQAYTSCKGDSEYICFIAVHVEMSELRAIYYSNLIPVNF